MMLSKELDWIIERIKRLLSSSKRVEMPVELDKENNQERYLIVGLGNPGRKYENNRHNIGFMAVDRLANVAAISVNRVQQNSLIGTGQIAGVPVMLIKPQTFMNNSGMAVGSLARFYKIPTEKILVIYDELDLPFGALRLRQKGGAGGHNGMKSIIQHLGQEFPRVRLGIGRPPGKMDPADYVLRDFRADDRLVVEELLGEVVLAVESFITDGIDLAMTRHNKGYGEPS